MLRTCKDEFKEVFFPPPKAPPVTAQKIKEAAADIFGYSVEQIEGQDRSAELANARHATALAIYIMTNMSLSGTGKVLSGRDHSTIYNSCTRAKSLYLDRISFRSKLDRLFAQFGKEV